MNHDIATAGMKPNPRPGQLVRTLVWTLVWTLALAEFRAPLGGAADEGWNPGFGDAVAFHAAGPDFSIDAFVDGAMVAGIAAVA